MSVITVQGEFKIGDREFVIIEKITLERILASQDLSSEDRELLDGLTECDLDETDLVSEEEAMSFLFGNNIAHYRKLVGLSQQDLADKAGFHQSAIARWESGKVNPTFRNIRKLAEALSCEFSDLLSDPE